jgi:hypothetical protein
MANFAAKILITNPKISEIRIIRDKKTLAKTYLLCIIVFMSENRTTSSPHKANLSLNTLLLRRKAQ